MSRRKQRIKQLHQPSTHEIFVCLSGYPSYSRILLSERPDKKYLPFLEWIVENSFYNERAGKVSIKAIAADFGADTAKVTAWLRAIYEDIFELNQEKPELFQQSGIKVSLSMSYFDNYCMFYTVLPALPRRFENLHFHFVKAKLGDWTFWVKDIYYELDEQPTIHLTLDGSILNRYREFLLEKALFQRKLGRSDLSDMYEFQVDDWLQQFDR